MSAPDDERGLLERLVALEEKVATLEAELAQRHYTSMKRHKRCPCGSGSILHVASVRRENLRPLAVQPGFLSEQGVFEAYVCRMCQLVEWHVIDLAKVKIQDTVTEYSTERLEPEPPGEPYR